MRKFLLFLLGIIIPASYAAARDFSYTFQGTTLYYTVLDEEAKTCMTRAGYNTTTSSASGWVTTFNPGNKVSGDVKIPDEAYDGTDFYKVIEIGNSSFYSNKELTAISIPGSVMFVGEKAFDTCNALVDFNFQETENATQPYSGSFTTTYTDFEASGSSSRSKEYELDVLPGSVLTFSHKAVLDYSSFVIKLGDEVVVSTASNSTESHEYTFDTAATIVLKVNFYGKYTYDSGRIYNIKLTSPWATENGEIFITKNAFANSSIENIISGRNFLDSPTPFKNKTSLKTLTFTEKVASIGDYSFDGCDGLTDIKCLSKVPPMASDATFSAPTYRYAALNVPANTKDAYAESPGWKNFANTVEDRILPSSITLSSQVLSLNVGQTGLLTATIEPDNVTDKTVLWSSSANDIATVQNGLVTGVKPGQTIVTASIGDLVASCVVTVTSANPGEGGGNGAIGWEEGDENAKIKERLYMLPEEEYNLTQMLGELKASSWTSSNEEIAEVTRRGIVYAYEFGESIVRAKDASGITVAIFEIYVCPTITIQHGEGILYTHHVLYNSKPKLSLAPGKGIKIAGITHDGVNVPDEMIDASGNYTPEKQIKENSVINLVIEQDPEGGSSAGSGSIMSDADVRIYVDGHSVRIVGADPGTVISLFDLNGKMLLNNTDTTVNVNDEGVYLLKVGARTYKILIK